MPRWSYLFLVLMLTGCPDEPVLSGSQQDLTQSTSRPQSATPQATALPAEASSALGGIVRDSVSGKLVAKASVRLDARNTETDQAGFYQFLLPSLGEAKLIVQHPDYQPFNQTLQLDGTRRIVDVSLTPLANSSSPAPSASQPPLVLLPNGSASPASAIPASASPASSSSPNSNPTASPTVSQSSSPNPSASPAYDPVLDDAAQTDLLLKRHPNGLELLFLLQKSNGMPVNWEWGQVTIQYFISTTTGTPIANGVSVMNSFGDKFVVNPSVSTLPDQVKVQYSLTLPDDRKLSADTTVQVK